MKVGDMYAVNAGTYGGMYLVAVEEKEQEYMFVTLPDRVVLNVPVSDINDGIDKDIITHVASLPDGVYAYCKKIYEDRKKDNNF